MASAGHAHTCGVQPWLSHEEQTDLPGQMQNHCRFAHFFAARAGSGRNASQWPPRATLTHVASSHGCLTRNRRTCRAKCKTIVVSRTFWRREPEVDATLANGLRGPRSHMWRPAMAVSRGTDGLAGPNAKPLSFRALFGGASRKWTQR